MASVKEVLEALNTKEAAVSTDELAKELKASVEGTRKQLSRLKAKEYIEGDSQEGWLITETGKKDLEGGGLHPTMIEEGVTPRQQFEAIARQIGIKEDRVVLATDIVWSGDYEDLNWVWDALGQADIRNDLRKVWCNSWRAKIHKGIPPELESELTNLGREVTAEGEKGVKARVKTNKDYIIDDDMPVRVGEGLGDFSLQDAKDILSIRAIKGRFGSSTQGTQAGVASPQDKLSDLLTALAPYIKKDTDTDMLRETIADKMEIQRQDIMSRIQQGQTTQQKPFMEQLTEFVGAIGQLKNAGPILRSILGVPEQSSNPGMPVQTTGPDGKPIVMDLGQVIEWRKFQGEERRADEMHTAKVGLAQAARENIPDGVKAIMAAVTEIKGKTPAGTEQKAKEAPVSKPQTFSCGDCKTQFSAPPEWAGQSLKCPNPECGREYTKEELEA